MIYDDNYINNEIILFSQKNIIIVFSRVFLTE